MGPVPPVRWHRMVPVMPAWDADLGQFVERVLTPGLPPAPSPPAPQD